MTYHTGNHNFRQMLTATQLIMYFPECFNRTIITAYCHMKCFTHGITVYDFFDISWVNSCVWWCY